MKAALLDTDTISYFFRGDSKVALNLDNYLLENERVYISSITFYEVLNGLYYKDAKRQLQVFESFVSFNEVLPMDQMIASRSARIFSDLRTLGQPIGHNDVIIAGTALVHDLTLVTNNTRHFSRINDLRTLNWMEVAP